MTNYQTAADICFYVFGYIVHCHYFAQCNVRCVFSNTGLPGITISQALQPILQTN